jgi:hypothetical protein
MLGYVCLFIIDPGLYRRILLLILRCVDMAYGRVITLPFWLATHRMLA